MKISGFYREYQFFSNFVLVDVVLDGVTYKSVEHAYQAAKTHSVSQRAIVRMARTSAIAKSIGRGVTLREDWESVKFDVMEGLLRQKFAQEPFRSKMLATGDQELVEDNNWNDRVWGVCNGVGENHLGRLLMKIRASL